MVKNLPAMWETWVRPLGWEDTLKEGMATHSSILVHGEYCPGTVLLSMENPHGQRSLASYSPWGHKELDTTERPSTAWASSVSQLVKNPPANAGHTRDKGLIPGLERSPEERNGNALQYSFLDNSKDRGASWATVHGAQSQT